MNLQHPKARVESIRQQAEEDLKDHQVTLVADTVGVRCWKCAQPGTWMYGFFVTAIPRYAFLAGDIGEMVFCPTHPNPLDFCKGENWDYQLGKASADFREQKEVSPYLVRQALDQVVRGYRGERRLPEDLKALCREVRGNSYELVDGLDDWYRRICEIDHDAWDIPVTVPTHGIVYRIFALQWFGRWLAQQEAKAA